MMKKAGKWEVCFGCDTRLWGIWIMGSWCYFAVCWGIMFSLTGIRLACVLMVIVFDTLIWLHCYYTTILVWFWFCWFGFMSAIVGFPSGYLENGKKSGVLFLLFEYSSQGSCPSICLEALQVILLENIFCHRLLSVMYSLCFVKVSLYVLTLLQSVECIKDC